MYSERMQINDTSKVTRDSDKFQVRFPAGMRERISESAERNGRSMNAEIVDRLRLSFMQHSDAEGLLVARQTSMINFLCECIEQLASIDPQDVEGQVKRDTIFALYGGMISDAKVKLE